MNKSTRIILAVAAMLYLPYVQSKASDVQVSKKVNKEFKITPNGTVDLSNKFGKVHINTNLPAGQVQVAIEIIVTRQNDKDAAKLLSEIQIEFLEENGGLKVTSILPEKMKTNSKERLEVNMTVNMSSQNPIRAKHSFGDLYLGNHSTSQDLKVSYGHLKAEELKGKTDIKVAFGNLSLKSANTAQIKIEYSNAKIERVSELQLKDDFSTLNLGRVGNLTLTSKYGKIEIGEASQVSGSASFASDFSIEQLSKSLDVQIKYVSDLDVNLTSGSLDLVKVNASFSNVEISYPSGLNFILKGNMSFGSLDYPTSRIQSSKIEKGINSEQVQINYGLAQSSTIFDLSGSYSEIKLSPR
jgi:hypothetical protein